VKEKSPFQKLPNNVPFKTSSSNLFLNIVIILLGIIIIFLAFSLYTKIKGVFEENDSPAANRSSHIIQVEVLNGCGKPGAADELTDFLRRNNFDVVHMGNYISFDVDKTLVIDRTGDPANAEKVAKFLGLDKNQVITQINKDYFLDVSIILGKDYNQLKLN
jgi:LytR cell envelope-related transcriptional attenuator